MLNIFIGVMITTMWINAKPMILLKRLFGFKEEEEYGQLKSFIRELIYCALCSGFWIGFLVHILDKKTEWTLEYLSYVILTGILSELLVRKLNS